MISREEFRRYDERLSRISGSASSYVSRMLSAFAADRPRAPLADFREYAVEVMRAAIDYYGDASATEAANLIEAKIAGDAAASVDPGPTEEQVRAVAYKQAAKLTEGRVEDFADACARYAADAVTRRADRTVSGTARASAGKRYSRKRGAAPKIRYARVPTGDRTCTFCVMLASRGFVYWSAESAGQMDRYHRNCRCRTVPSTERDGLEGYDPDALYDLWQKLDEIDKDGSLSSAEKKLLKARAAGVKGRVGRERGADPWQKEWDTASMLSSLGVDVRFIREPKTEKCPDAYLDGCEEAGFDGRAWEFKVPEGFGPKTIKNQVKNAAGKGTDSVLISNAANGASDREMVAAIEEFIDSPEYAEISPDIKRMAFVGRQGAARLFKR